MIIPATYGATAAIEAWTETIEHDIYAYSEADFVYQTWYVNQGVIDADPMWATNFTSMIYDRSPMTSDYYYAPTKAYGQQNGSYLQVYCHTYTELNGPVPTNQVPRVTNAVEYPVLCARQPYEQVAELDEGTTFRWGGGEATYCWTIDIRSYVKFNASGLHAMMDKKLDGTLDRVDLVLTQAPTWSPTTAETDAPYTIYVRPFLGGSDIDYSNYTAPSGDTVYAAISDSYTIPLDGVWRWYDVPFAGNGDIKDMFLNDTGPYAVGLGHDTTTGVVSLASGMTEEQAYAVDTTQTDANGLRARIYYENGTPGLNAIKASFNWMLTTDSSSGLPKDYMATRPYEEFDFYELNQVAYNNVYRDK
jgi:hypothetical protein